MIRERIFHLLLIALPMGFAGAQSNPFDGWSNFVTHLGARNVGLAGSNGAESNGELDAWMVNPANLSPFSWSNAALHSSFSPAEIQTFSVLGLLSRDTVWPLALGLMHTSFGRNVRYDTEGNSTGEFRAATNGLHLGTRRKLSESVFIGTSINYDWRTIDFYHSHVLHFAVGGIYETSPYNSFGLSLSNLGYEIVPFHNQRHSLPLDLSVYWRRQLEYLPFTFFLRMHRLNLWNRLEFAHPYDHGDQNLNQDPPPDSRLRSFTAELLRHMIVGGEFHFGHPGNVWLRFSYDHWRNQQLGIPTIRSLEGIAVGFGIRIKVLRLDYTWERVYFDSSGHQLSLSFRLFEKTRREKGF